ncbi:glycosyltransferase [Roseivirga sp. E12]|uniref:glycosyltransferase n=1 Tax=Roseivirga sp. E12 TaxID=2819237 RepID=UPI001ABCC836|nr:glycosyltransferase [Roseivirga sp. E12]MBO3699082.1 glycosyltransferase [Roseivirga sp. E12]
MSKESSFIQRKRILFTIPNFDTAGSGGAMLKIAERLNPEIFEPQIACFHNKGDFFKKVEASKIPVHLIKYISVTRPISTLLKGAWGVSRQFKALNADLVHSFHYGSDYTEALAAKLAGIPWVFTKKNMSWGGGSANSWKLRSRLASGIAVQNTDMQRDFYPRSSKTHLIPRGVDAVNFYSAIPSMSIRKKMCTPSESRIVICVANMVSVKGIELLIKAFQLASEKSEGWVLWLVGDYDSEYGKALVNHVETEDLTGIIRFSGKVANVREYLDHAEIFVLPTKNEGRREGSPVSLLEAMANGKVVLGSSIAGIKDQLADFQENMFQAGDVNHLEERLHTFMQQSTEENQNIGQQFRQFVKEQFPIDLEVKRHESFYRHHLKI